MVSLSFHNFCSSVRLTHVEDYSQKWTLPAAHTLTSDFSAPPIRTKSVIPHHLSLALWSELTNRMWQKWQCAKCKPGPQETLARLCSSPLCPDGWHRPASQCMRPAAALQPKASQPSLWVSLDESVVSCPLSWPQHNWQKAQLRSTQPGLDP